MTASRSLHQQELGVQAGLVSSLTSLFSQKLNSTEELRKVPVVKPIPIRWRAQPPASHLGYTQVGKPALIQLVHSTSSSGEQLQQQQQQQQQRQPHQQQEATSYITKKTKYSSRSDLARSAQARPGAEQYRLEEWTVYETLPVDLAASSRTTAADEAAERRRLKAEFEEKRRLQQEQRERLREVGTAATPEMFTREEWTVYETVPSQRVPVTRSASSGAQRTNQDRQQHQQQLHRAESTDSLLGYRRYLTETNSGKSASQSTTSAKTKTTVTKTKTNAYNGSVGGGAVARKTARTPEVFTAEEWSVYETIPAVTSLPQEQQQQQKQQEQQRQTKRSVRWTSDEVKKPTNSTRTKTPDIFTKEEWTVYETIPTVQEAVSQRPLHRSSSQESVVGYRRYLDNYNDKERRKSAVTNTAEQRQRQSVQQSSSSSSRTTETRRVRNGEGRVGTPVRREEWTVIQRVPADSAPGWPRSQQADEVDGAWRRRTADSPAGYRRYLETDSSNSLAAELGEFNQLSGLPDRRRAGANQSGLITESENPFHSGYHVARDNPIYIGL